MTTREISAITLAKIVNQLLTAPQATGEFNQIGSLEGFMKDIAICVGAWCGGNVVSASPDSSGNWFVTVKNDTSLPENGGIWDRMKLANQLAGQFSNELGYGHPEYSQILWLKAHEQSRTQFEYWEWVAEQVMLSNSTNRTLSV